MGALAKILDLPAYEQMPTEYRAVVHDGTKDSAFRIEKLMREARQTWVEAEYSPA